MKLFFESGSKAAPVTGHGRRKIRPARDQAAYYQQALCKCAFHFFERKGCEKQPRESRNFLRKLASPSRYFQAAEFSRPIERYLSVTGINVSCNKGGGKKPRGNNRAPSRNTTPHWAQGPLGVGYFHTPPQLAMSTEVGHGRRPCPMTACAPLEPGTLTHCQGA